ncbi:hypothetical protein [Streptomyces olivochromogenes]|uniref:Uncharacterized protein n=1 Tax=Streptomyces olivochromogenes TaxID=1963 RepID=A0A250VTF6_STROL|nr:hypothetical protein [Streptomyces olivochromogenes]KUN38247.1 hypothetical protein AQJ27_44915 [Streptomyces olivochromogenes]GAX57312.1 hypothetical protein SO3561_08882 [Streptomyces olivochromogenes]
MPEPSVGDIVHYVSYGTPGGEYGKECRAAVITAVVAGTDRGKDEHGVTTAPAVVSLAVLNPTGMFFNEQVAYEGSAEDGGTWHWRADD